MHKFGHRTSGIPQYCGVVVFLVGVLVIFGWHFDIRWLKSFWPGLISMKVNTALGIISLATSLLALHNSSLKRSFWAFPGVIFSFLIGALTLIQYVMGYDFSIDEYFYRDLESGVSPAGRFSPVAAIILLLLSTGAILIGRYKRPFYKTAHVLFLIAFMVSFHGVLEYGLTLQGLFGNSGHARMAVPTTLSFIFLSMGLLFLTPSKGYMRMLLSQGRAGMLSRTLVVALIFAPPLIRFGVDLAEERDFLDPEAVPLVRTLLTISFFIVVVLRSLQELVVREKQMRRAEQSKSRHEKKRQNMIADQRLAESTMLNEARMRAMFDLSYAAIIGFHDNGEITDWNLQAERIFGWSKTEAVGKNFIDSLFPEDLHDIMRRRFRLMTNFMKSEDTKKIPEVMMVRKNKSLFPAQVGITTIYLNGDLLILTSIEDISERKSSEKELIRTRQEALVASSAKSEFLANMSHEIRTPMNGIIGMATVLSGENLTPKQLGQVNLIRKSAQSLVSLINGILDHSRIESGVLTLDVVNFDLKELVEDTVAMFQFLAMEKKIELKIELNLHNRRYVQADANRLRQILVNLIGNAIKFTEKGSVIVRGGISEIQSPDIRLWFEVQDSGCGISQQDARSLFVANAQTQEGKRRGGAGLGLYISRRLAEIMGGNISVQSEMGQGACFSFYINAHIGMSPSAISASNLKVDLKGFRVLVVEDQPINQQVVVSYLNVLGIESEVAENGQDAVNLFKTKNYDLILMDCRMPIMNGEEATKQIRSLEKTQNRSSVPILGLSAETSLKDKDVCLDVGMDGFLSKPLSFENLTDALALYLRKEDLPAIDNRSLDNLLQYAVNETHLLHSLMEDFERTSERSIIDFNLAVRENNIKKLSDVAHGMKSACATLGAHRASNQCAEIEKLEAIPDDIQSRILKLDGLFKKVKNELYEYLSSRVS